MKPFRVSLAEVLDLEASPHPHVNCGQVAVCDTRAYRVAVVRTGYVSEHRVAIQDRLVAHDYRVRLIKSDPAKPKSELSRLCSTDRETSSYGGIAQISIYVEVAHFEDVHVARSISGPKSRWRKFEK